MEDKKEFKGNGGTLIITPTGVIFKRGILSGAGWFKGEKTIPFSSITSVRYKKAGLMNGYLSLSLKGSIEKGGSIWTAAGDENSIVFNVWANKRFEEAKQIIEEKISMSDGPKSSNLDELEKLGKLKESGVISQEEFDLKKKQLLQI